MKYFYNPIKTNLAAGRKKPFGRMPVDAFDVGAVAAKDPLLGAAEEVPDAYGAVVGA